MSSTHVLLAGVSVLAVGTALAFVGVVVPGLFPPGLISIAAGLVLCAVAGVIAVIRSAAGAADAEGA